MNWIAKAMVHDGVARIGVFFEKNAEWIARIKLVEGARWSQRNGCWHVPDSVENRIRFGVAAARIPSEEGILAIRGFEMWLRSKRYSESTVVIYSDALKLFLFFFKEKAVADITNEDVVVFNNVYLLEKKLSASYQNQIVNAIKLFFATVLDRKLEIEKIHRPKRAKVLPNVLSKEEVKLILNAHANIKHRMMLCLIYSCGLRCGELLALRPLDIDSNRNVVLIKNAKGKKDRIAPLSPKILVMLRDYYLACKPKVFLFEGNEPGMAYNSRSLQQVLKQALVKVGIEKAVTLHWLRHSYATHLMECGTDLRYIQELLGHSSSKTTEIYTHVSTKSIQQIKSPFDDL